MDKIIKFISKIVVLPLDNSLDFGVIDDVIHSIYFDFCSCMFDLCQPMLDAVLATTHVKHMGHIGRRRPICSSAQGFNADTAPYVFDLKRGRGGALCGAYSQDGTFSRNDFAYDHQGDTYTCPEGKLLTTRGTLVNDGATMLYRASTFDCAACALKPKCCPKTPARKVPRSIHEGARDMARDIAKTDAYVVSRRERKKIEMLFAHLKRILGLDRRRLRRPCGARDEFHLAATAQNLRKLAKLITVPDAVPAT